MKKYIILVFSFCIVLLSGCSGFSRLPEINFVGKSREEVVKIFASNPAKPWGTHIHISVPGSSRYPHFCNCGLYFKTIKDAFADERIQKAAAMGGYHTERHLAFPTGWDYYVVIFDKNNIAVSQKITSYFDGP